MRGGLFIEFGGTAVTTPANAVDKPIWVLDTEIYKNYLLIGFRNRVTRKVLSFEVEGRDSQLGEEDARLLRKFMFSKKTVGFNSIPFDLPIIYAAINGLTVLEIKGIADDIIISGVRPWDIERERGFKIPRGIDHIDLIEVAPGQASLKVYNGRIHGKRMQDLPIEPDAILTPDEIEETYQYWLNDLDATEGLWDALKTQIELREAMTAEFGVDLRSKSDAQIAEAVIKHEIENMTGYVPKKPVKIGGGFRYDIPDYIKFTGARMNALLDDLYDATFRLGPSGKVILPEFLSEAPIKIGKGEYRMGIGGLHSSEKNQHAYADEDHVLIERDVRSYYPRIIINLNLMPEHLGPAFLKVYTKIVDRRLREKDLAAVAEAERDTFPKGSPEWEVANTKHTKHHTNAESLKITINGLFGKFGSRFAVVYSPKLLIQTTVTGQLSLLMLIQRLHNEDIPVVSANTDGIVIRCHKEDVELMNDIVREWEEDTGFETDSTPYDHLYSRDVNNYIAVKTGGKSVKTKGAFAIAQPGRPPLLQKNPTNEIAVQAVIDHILTGVSLTKTIRECEDITKFLTVRTVRGGGVHGLPTDPESKYLGKAIRWYYGVGSVGSIHYKTPNTKGNFNKVPKSEGAVPCMNLPKHLPEDIDYGWYIREARSILKDIAFHEQLV